MAQQAGADAGQASEEPEAEEAKKDDNVVDAEYEEVNDKK